MVTLLLMLAFALQVDQRWDFHSRVGLVRVDSDGGCLAINAQGLKRWDHVFVVGLEERPARTFSAEIVSSVESCLGISRFESAYRVSGHSDFPTAELMSAAVRVSRTIVYRDGRIAFQLLPAPTPHLLHFATCSEDRALRVRLLSRHPTPGTEVWSVLVPDTGIGVPACPH